MDICCSPRSKEFPSQYAADGPDFTHLLVQLAGAHEHEVVGLRCEVASLRAKVARLEKMEGVLIDSRETSRSRAAPSKIGQFALGATNHKEDEATVLSEVQSPGKAKRTYSLPVTPVKEPNFSNGPEANTPGDYCNGSDLNDITLTPEDISTTEAFKVLDDDTSCVKLLEDHARSNHRRSTVDMDVRRVVSTKSSSTRDSAVLNLPAGSLQLAAWQGDSSVCFEHDNWRRFVVMILENAGREMYQLKPHWCQTESFLQKARRAGHPGQHPIDFFNKNDTRARSKLTTQLSFSTSKFASSTNLDRSSAASSPAESISRKTFFWPLSRGSGGASVKSSSDAARGQRSFWFGAGTSENQSCALNPSSPARIAWSLAGLVLMIYDLIMLPMQVFDLPDDPVLKAIAWTAQTYWTLDIGISFITGIYVKSELEMRINVIARMYLMTWFPIDVIITIPLWFVLLMDVDSSAEAGRGLKSARYVRMLRFLRLARLMKAEHLLGEAMELLNSTSVLLTLGIVKLMVCMVLCNHVVACIWYAVGRSTQQDETGWALEVEVDSRSIPYKYFTAMHWTLTQFQGTSEIVVGGTLQERTYAVWTVLFALIMLAIFVSGLTNMMMQLQSLQSKRTHEQRVVRGYLNNHKVSQRLSVRIKKHIAWKQRQQQRSEHDSEVSKLLPQQLMMDLLDEVRGPLICQHHYFFFKFREAYPFVIRRLCHEALEPVNPTPGELIFSPSDESTTMYFLVSGALYYTAISHAHRKTFRHVDGKKGEQLGELSSHHITDGQYLSEPVLWTTWEHAGELQVVRDAKCDAQMLYLIAETFAECVKNTGGPALASATLYARRYLAFLNRFGKTFTDFIPPEEVLDCMLEEDGTEKEGTDSSNVPIGRTPFSRASRASIMVGRLSIRHWNSSS